MSNIYYNPEDFGLTIFGMVEQDLSYSFDMFVIWRNNDTDTLYYKTDSGCSCPSPFEDDTRETLIPIDPYHLQSFVAELRSWANHGVFEENNTDESPPKVSFDKIIELEDKVSKHYNFIMKKGN